MIRTIILFLVIATGAHAQNAYTLEEARRDALERSHDVGIAAIGVADAEEGITAARARRLPQLDVSAGYTHVSETGGIDIQLPGMPTRHIRFGDGNIWETAVTARVPLFTGFRLSSQQAISEKRVDVAEETLTGTRTAVRHRVALIYRRAQLARRSGRIYDEQLTWLHAQLNMLRAMLAEGQVLPYDTLLLSTRVSALRVEQRNARMEYDNAIEDLREITRRDIGDRPLSEDVETDPGFPGLRDDISLLEIAERNRSDLRVLGQQREILQLQMQSEQSAMYPTVAAFASYRYGKPGVDQVANEWMNYYTAGVSLEWNLWSWGGDRANVQRRQYGVQIIEEEYARKKNAVRVSIRKLRNELEVLEDTRMMLEDQIRKEQARQRLLQARFREGIATATEVVDAETALTSARLRREQADIQYAMKITELAATIGWNE